MEDVELSTFLAIARYGSLRSASQNLRVAQSTVSQRLQALEARVGERVFERRRGQAHVYLTPQGEALMELAIRWEAVTQEIAAIGARDRMALRVAAGDSINRFLLPPVYHRLVVEAPHLNLKIESSDSAQMYDRLERRDVDLAIVMYPRYQADLTVRLLMWEEMVVLTGALNAPNQVLLTPEQLDPSEEIFLDWGEQVARWRAEFFGGFKGRMHIDPAHLLVPLLTESQRWAVVPVSVARGLSGRGVHVRRLTAPVLKRPLYEARHRLLSRAAEAAVGLFERVLSDLLAAEQEEPAP